MASSSSLLSSSKKPADEKPNERFINPVQLSKLEHIVQQRMGVVCQVQTPIQKGTGCLVGGDLLITNFHIIPDINTAEKSYAIFFRVTSQDVDKNETIVQIKRLRLNPSKYFHNSPNNKKEGDSARPADSDHLDFTIVAVEGDPYLEQVQDRVFSLFKNIVPESTSLACILQHPKEIDSKTAIQGDLKWSSGLIHQKKDCSIHYDIETAPGSSGGAVINDRGELIALHYQGRVKCGCNPRLPQCNAGVLMTEIVRHLERKKERAKIEEIIRNYHQEISLRLPQLVQSLANHLTSFYQKQMTAVYRVRAGGAWEISLPIEGVFTDLAMVCEEARKTENDLRKKGNGIPTHETPSKIKQPIALPDIFNHEKFINVPSKRGVIFGVAGVGKTTLCQMLALKGRKLWPQFKVVFFIKLRHLNEKKYPKGCTLYELLAKECQFDLVTYQSLLNDPKFLEDSLLLLDGYDELPKEAEKNGSLSETFQKLQEIFPHILVTSRPTLVNMDGLTELEITGFNRQNVDTYIEKFFSLLAQRKEISEEEAKRKTLKLKQDIKKRPILAGLLQIPINLSLACSLCREDEEFFDSFLIASVSSFYNEAVNWFYKKYQLRPEVSDQSVTSIRQQKNPRAMCKKVDDLAHACESIAWWAMQRNSLYIDQRVIEIILGEKGLNLDDLTHLGLLTLEEGQGQFIHLTFQEYFAAGYLACFYIEKKQDEVVKILRTIKFNLRYADTLVLTAGYLSYHRDVVLQAFFKDLMSEPYDLAVGNGLTLLAWCFEACHDLIALKEEYRHFIKKVVVYLQENLPKELKVNVLAGSQKLLKQEEIVQFFEKQLTEKRTQKEMVSILHSLAYEKQIFPERILVMFSKILKDPQDSSLVKCLVVSTLNEVSKNGQVLSEKEIEGLMVLLQDLKADSWVLEEVVKVFGEIVKSEQPLVQKTMEDLLVILKDPNVDSRIKRWVATAFGEMAKNGQILPREVLEKLIAFFQDLQNKSDDAGGAAYAFLKVVESGHALPQGVMEVLLLILKDPEAGFYARLNIVEIFSKIIQSGQAQSKEAMIGLFAYLKDPGVESETRDEVTKILCLAIKNGQALHPELVDDLLVLIKDMHADYMDRCIAIKVLAQLAIDQALPQKTVKDLLALVKDLQADSEIRGVAALILGLTKNDQDQSREVIDGLLVLINERQANSIPVNGAAMALANMVIISGQVLPQEAVDHLFVFLKHPNADFEAQALTISALERVVTSEQAQSRQAMEGLFSLIKDPEADAGVRDLAAEALGQVATSGQAQSRQAMEDLFALLRDPKTGFEALNRVVLAFAVVATREQGLPEEIVENLVKLFRDRKIDSDAYYKAIFAHRKSKEIQFKKSVENLSMLLRDSRTDFTSRREAAETLTEKIKSGQVLLQEIEEVLVTLLRNPKTESATRGLAAKICGEAVQNGQVLSPKIVESLFEFLKASQADFLDRSQAVLALNNVAKKEQAYSQECEKTLLVFFRDIQAAYAGPSRASDAFALLAENGQAFSPEVVGKLFITFLKDPQVDSYARGKEVLTLRKVVRREWVLPAEAVEGMLALLKDMKADSWARSQAANALGEIAEKGQLLAQEALAVICNDPELIKERNLLNRFAVACCKFPYPHEPYLLKQLFFLTGYAFYFHEGVFYTSGREGFLKTKSLDPQQDYEELKKNIHLLFQKKEEVVQIG